jgi:uncharacterized protein YjiS (DUF1127 family)
MTTMDVDRAASADPDVRSFGLLAWMAAWFKRWAQRRAERATLISLSRMDAYMLRDIGIEPRDIMDALNGRRSSILLDPTRKG